METSNGGIFASDLTELLVKFAPRRDTGRQESKGGATGATGKPLKVEASCAEPSHRTPERSPNASI